MIAQCMNGMNTVSLLLALSVSLLIQGGCNPEFQPGGTRDVEPAPVGPDDIPPPAYDFAAPALSHPLPGRLVEISGIATLDDRQVAAIEDNVGVLFIIDVESGEVVSERRFAGGADYEEVELVGDRLFVLESGGHLFEVVDWQAEEPDEVNRTKVDLPGGCDAEGLAREPETQRLLISCKEKPGDGVGDGRAIYAFDLASRSLSEEPIIVLSFDEIQGFMDAAEKAFDASGLDFEHGAKSFKPSAIRFHPVTGELYVLSSVTKAILVLSADGEIRAAYPLSEKILRQPEGLAFRENGDLVISSEGRGKDGSIHLFRYMPTHEE